VVTVAVSLSLASWLATVLAVQVAVFVTGAIDDGGLSQESAGGGSRMYGKLLNRVPR